MQDLPIPFGVKLLKRAAGGMEHHHLGNITKAETRGAGAPAPFHILRNLDSVEEADGVEVAPIHRQVSGAGITVLFDIELEAVGEDALVRLDRIEGILAGTPDSDIAAEHGSRLGGDERRPDTAQPVRIGATIGVDEGKNFALRRRDASIPCWPRPGAALSEQARVGMSRHDFPRDIYGAVVDNNDLEQVAAECLRIKAREAGFEPVRLVEMRNNHRNHYFI